MPKPKRLLNATVELTVNPPAQLPPNHMIARVSQGAGKNLYTVTSPEGTSLLVELSPQFRSSLWLRKGGFVVVDTAAFADRDNKLEGEIVNIVRDEKQWRKAPWWPKEFPKQDLLATDDDENESNVGKMPPSDSEGES